MPSKRIHPCGLTVLALTFTFACLSLAGYLVYPLAEGFLEKYGHFLFEAGLSDFRTWYPRFGLPAFLAIKAFNLFLLLLFAWFFFGAFRHLRGSMDSAISWAFRHWKDWFPLQTLDWPRFDYRKLWIRSFQWYQKQLWTAHFFYSFLVFVICLCWYFAYTHFLRDPGFPGHLGQLFITRIFVTALFVQVIPLVWFRYRSIFEFLRQFFFIPARPESLSVIRILFFLFLSIKIMEFREFYAYFLESGSIKALPYMEWYSGLIVMDRATYEGLCSIGFLVSLFIAVGLFTRFFLILNIPLIFLIIATPNFYGKLIHNQIFIWIPWILAFSRCYDIWSVDAFFRRKREKPLYGGGTSPLYGFPVRLLWLQFGLLYFFPGFHKFWSGGFDWALSDSMIYQIQLEWVQHYDQVPWPRPDHFPLLVKLGGLMVIFWEMSFVFLVLFRRWRWVAILGGLVMHNLAGHFMYIGFVNLQILYLVFIPWERILGRKQEGERSGKVNIFDHALWRTPGFLFGSGVLLGNFLTGLLGIHSYPFSSYPTYHAIIGPEVEELEWVGYDGNGDSLLVEVFALEAGFRKEDLTVFESEIIRDHFSGELDVSAIRNYWSMWKEKVPKLEWVDQLQLYYCKTLLEPEKRDSFIVRELLWEGNAGQLYQWE